MSLQREEIKKWLSGMSFKGLVIGDVGCGNKPVSKYIDMDSCLFWRMDIDPDVSDIGSFDIQTEIFQGFDVLFCIEALDHIVDPVSAFKNFYRMLNDGGKLYLSVAFLYPNHGNNDGLRYSRRGLERLVEKAGFISYQITPRYTESDHLKNYFLTEGIDHNNLEIGYFLEAKK